MSRLVRVLAILMLAELLVLAPRVASGQEVGSASGQEAQPASGAEAGPATVQQARPANGRQVRSASEPDVAAAFLISFAKFTEWPADALPADAQLRLCVTDPNVSGALSRAARIHPLVGTHPIDVYLLTGDTSVPPDCRVLYVSGVDDRHAALLLAAIGDTSVLSVGDSAAFTGAGGVMHLYVEDGRMRFAVNVSAAERARLRLSSKLLTLARIVGGK